MVRFLTTLFSLTLSIYHSIYILSTSLYFTWKNGYSFLVILKVWPHYWPLILSFHLRRQTGCTLPISHMYCYTEFSILKISIRVKELFEPIVLQRNGDGFLLFSEAFSWETELWMTVGNFTLKRKIGKGNLSLTKNLLGRKGNCYAEDNHSCMSNIGAKIRTFVKKLLTK